MANHITLRSFRWIVLIVPVVVILGSCSDHQAITPSEGSASGKWLVGGLVDSHVHTQQSERQTLLHLKPS